MTNQFENLTRLVHLASEPSDESRRNLLREITDVFMAEPGSYSESQNWYFGEIMGQVAYDLEREMRVELANRLAAEGSAPHDLIRRLANDEIAIARPVLQQSPVLSQDDLIDITRNRSQDHLRAISVRGDIGAELSQSLVTHGDDTVVIGLLRNERAQIHDDTFGEIVQRSVDREAIQAAVIDRSDVPKEILSRLMDHVSDKLRQQILERYADIGTEQLVGVLTAMKQEAADCSTTAAERHIDGLVRRGALTEWGLTRFIAEDRPMEFMVGFARLMGIGIDDAERILADKTGTPLAIICRANEISPESFKEFALSPFSGVPSDPAQVLPLVRVYLRLKPQHAQRTLRFWKTRKMTLENLQDVIKNGGRRPEAAPAKKSQQEITPPAPAGQSAAAV